VPRTVILASYLGRPQFVGARTETVEVLPHHTRRIVRATCGCEWHGLVGIRGAGVSDGSLHLCAQHAIPDDAD
jgi:hypothetical protein